ncbi:MAG TPA: Ig-like domain-containing protein, partial [Pyrinomonadaceae bacterium]|nr:Ig-like domain-containing protein [Pyrinomonadaceae bacterium]
MRAKLGLVKAEKPAMVPQPQAQKSVRMGTDLQRVLNAGKAARALSPAAPVAPTVTATKTDSLFADADSDTQADPGDTIKYTVNISASGSDATGVTFTDNVDPNTAFVPGSLTATPVAVDDTYSALGNVRISVAAPGVLGNDFTGIPAATITGAPVTSANGGNVTLNADGSFTYNPPAGFEGTDTFIYTLTNAAGSNNATVTINVSGMIWFINNTASCPCDGRLTNPFNSLASFQAVNNGAGNNPAANDNIFVYESAIDYVGPVTLLNGQKFIGQDATASLSSITGLTPPPESDPLPTMNSANATVANITSATTGIIVGSGNTLRGFTGGNAATDISGSAFGTLTISDVTLNGNGQALNLTTGTLAATFVSISSANSATTGISLTSVAGNLTSPTTTLTNPTGIGLTVNTSSGSLNFGNTNASASGSTGVSLTTNTGPITFGSLSISPDAGQRGLLATDNTNTITSTSGDISTSGATAVEISRAAGTTPLAISLTSVSANTAPPNGIFLKNTSGSFTINGDGTNTSVGGNSSGGTITGATGADGATSGIGVYLNNVTNVTLRRMTINGANQNFAIWGQTVTNFDLQYSKVSGTNGTNETLFESAVYFLGLVGSSNVTSSIIEGGRNDNWSVINTAGSLDRIIFNGDTFGKMDQGVAGNDSLFLQAQNSATIKATVQNSSLTDARGDIFQFDLANNAVGDLVFKGNTVNNTHPNIVTGGGGLTLSGGGLAASNVTFTYDIGGPNIADGNTFRGARGDALLVVLQNGHGNFTGRIRNNSFGVSGIDKSGSSEGTDIEVRTVARGAQTVNIDNNNIRQYGNSGILLQAGDISAGGTSGTVGDINATITNNTITEFNSNAASRNGIHVNLGTTSGDNTFMCVDVQNDSAATAGSTDSGLGSDYLLRQRQATTMRLPGYAGASGVPSAGTVVADVTSYIRGRNINGASSSVFVATPSAGGGYVGGATCTQPSFARANFNDAKPIDSNRILRDRLANHVKASARTASFDESAPDILRVAQGEPEGEKSSDQLSSAAVAVMAQAAIERWRAAGISVEDLARLQSVNFTVADLPEGQLASASGTNITIDDTAAGYGWYSDVSPTEDSEFDVPVPLRELQAREGSPAYGRVDLLTVLMRELGTVYLQGQQPSDQLSSLMANTVSPSVRRLPDSSSITLPQAQAKAGEKQANTKNSMVAKVSKPKSIRPASQKPAVKSNHAMRTRTAAAPMSFADVLLNIGTLPAGESVTITFNATVNNPFTSATPQVSNQGTVSGSNFASVLTDDPTVGGAADPTVTPIDLPAVSVAVSPAAVLEDGATNLVYTFTRTGSTTNAQTINFNVGGTASFGTDYTQTGAATFTASSGTVTFAAGNATATVTIDPSADTTVEPDETVSLTVTSGVGYTVGSPSSASGTITNDDTDVSVAVSPASVAEDGATNLTYTFTRAGVTSSSLTVNFSVGG